MYLALRWVDDRSTESMAIVCFSTQRVQPESSKILAQIAYHLEKAIIITTTSEGRTDPTYLSAQDEFCRRHIHK